MSRFVHVRCERRSMCYTPHPFCNFCCMFSARPSDREADGGLRAGEGVAGVTRLLNKVPVSRDCFGIFFNESNPPRAFNRLKRFC